MKNFIKTVGVTSCLVAAMGTTQALSQTRYPDWASNGPALIGKNGGIAGLDETGAISSTTQKFTSFTYTNLPSQATDGQFAFCSDCYSKLRESGDTATGIVVHWNSMTATWRDDLGLTVQH